MNTNTETTNHQNGQNNGQNANTNERIFKSAKVALPIMIDEYTKERERAGIIDTKAISVITILLALVTIYIPITPFEKIAKLYSTGSKSQLIMITLAVSIFFVSLIIIAIAFYNLISILKLKSYQRVNIEDISDENSLAWEEHIFEKAMCLHYKELISENSERTDKKSSKLNMCFILTIISFILLLISCLLIKFI